MERFFFRNSNVAARATKLDWPNTLIGSRKRKAVFFRPFVRSFAIRVSLSSERKLYLKNNRWTCLCARTFAPHIVINCTLYITHIDRFGSIMIKRADARTGRDWYCTCTTQAAAPTAAAAASSPPNNTCASELLRLLAEPRSVYFFLFSALVLSNLLCSCFAYDAYDAHASRSLVVRRCCLLEQK